MTKEEVLHALELLGSAATKKIYMRHGAREPFFGVKVGDLKKWKKKIGQDQALALALYNTGNSDAMYLAGLIEIFIELFFHIISHFIQIITL